VDRSISSRGGLQKIFPSIQDIYARKGTKIIYQKANLDFERWRSSSRDMMRANWGFRQLDKKEEMKDIVRSAMS